MFARGDRFVATDVSIRVPPRFRATVKEFRAPLPVSERMLFDVICLSATLGIRLPQDDTNFADLEGPLDPRPRLARGIRRILGTDAVAFTRRHWTAASSRLTRRLVRTLRARDIFAQDAAGNFEPLRSLLSFAPSVLGLTCAVPEQTVPRAAWRVVVHVLAEVHPSKVRRLDLSWIDRKHFATLVREARVTFLAGPTGGERPGPSGRRLAVDPRLVDTVRRAMMTSVEPAYIAQYVFYSRTGDYFWPHTDSLRVFVNVFICLEHVVPEGQATCSAFLGYHEDGSIERFELQAGDAIAAHTQGLVHARDPVQEGERVTLLAIAMTAGPKRSRGGHTGTARAARPPSRSRAARDQR